MATKTKIQESGAAGKPGETIARAGAAKAGTQPDSTKGLNLTSEGIASLLKGQFTTEPEPGEEVRPGEEPNVEVEGTQTEVEVEAGAGAPGGEPLPAGAGEEAAGEGAGAAAGEEAEGGEGQAAEEGAEGAAAEGADGLPEALQTALNEWEQAGGGELPPALQSLVERRIHKLTAAREQERERAEAAEARATELETALQEAQASGGQSSQAPAVLSEKELRKLEQTSEQFLADAENYLDETATPEERGRIEKFMESNRLDAAGLKRTLRETQRFLNQGLPAQKQQLAEYRKVEAQAEPEVKKWFPWMDKKESAEFQLAQGVLKSIPDLKQRTPLHRVVLGVYVLGLKQFEAMRKAATKAPAGSAGATAAGAAQRKAPVKAPVAGAAAPAARAAGKGAAYDQASAQFAKRPTAEGVTKLFKLGLH